MTRDELIRIARDLGGIVMERYDYGAKPNRILLLFEELERFAEMVAAAEREACARVVENMVRAADGMECVAAIRARGSHD
jgi:hypothetical protein